MELLNEYRHQSRITHATVLLSVNYDTENQHLVVADSKLPMGDVQIEEIGETFTAFQL